VGGQYRDKEVGGYCSNNIRENIRYKWDYIIMMIEMILLHLSLYIQLQYAWFMKGSIVFTTTICMVHERKK